MPAPSMTVTFIDVDGDQFPICMPGWWTKVERPKLVTAARRELQALVVAGKANPAEPITHVKVKLNA